MSRYIGPVCRLCRREGAKLFLKGEKCYIACVLERGKRKSAPGMHVNQSGGRGSLTQFRVRGAEANHLLVMIDGVPANAVGDGEYNFADIPLDDIERIELLRGPQSGLYGANAQSGVLTIVTKSGRGLTKPEFNARFEGGSDLHGLQHQAGDCLWRAIHRGRSFDNYEGHRYRIGQRNDLLLRRFGDEF